MKQTKVKRFRFGQALSAATMQRTGVAQPPSPVPITQLRVMLSERAFLAGEAPTPLLPDRPRPREMRAMVGHGYTGAGRVAQ